MSNAAESKKCSSSGIPYGSPSGIRGALLSEFARRKRVNRSYSLRAFAKFLAIDQSQLSKVLTGRLKASTPLTGRLAERLGMTADEAREIIEATKGASYFSSIADDQFNLISEPQHFAVLELIKTSSFRPSIEWVAVRLGIAQGEASAAVERLERLGFIELCENEWKLLEPNNTWSNRDRTSTARRNHQRELLTQALEAVNGIEFDRRENGSLTVACSSALLPEIKKKMHNFRRELDEFIQSRGEPEDVYQLVMSFFPISIDQKDSKK